MPALQCLALKSAHWSVGPSLHLLILNAMLGYNKACLNYNHKRPDMHYWNLIGHEGGGGVLSLKYADLRFGRSTSCDSRTRWVWGYCHPRNSSDCQGALPQIARCKTIFVMLGLKDELELMIADQFSCCTAASFLSCWILRTSWQWNSPDLYMVLRTSICFL